MHQPELYQKNNVQGSLFSAKFFDKYLHLMKWKNDETVLDIGTGDGRTALDVIFPRLPKNFKKFFGSDVSDVMVNFLKQKYNFPRTEFVQLDISSEIMPENFINEFDHIFSFYTLHFVDQRQAFTNIFLMLKPGGQILTTSCATSPTKMAFENMSKRSKWSKYKHEIFFSMFYDFEEPEKEMTKMLREIGFKNIECRLEDQTYCFSNYEMFKELFIAINGTVHNIPKEYVDEYCDEYLQEVRKSNSVFVRKSETNDDVFEVIFKMFIVFASKPEQHL